MSTNEPTLQSRVSRSLSWVGLASAAVAVLDFVAIILILSFWLTPTQYGIATKAWWMFAILDYAADLGLSAAVIQRDDHTETKLSTVFWLNMIMSGAVVLVLWAAHPLVAAFYGHVVVADMLVVYGIKVVFNNAYLIPQALMRRELRYAELSKIRVASNVAEFGGKVGSAAMGFGPWCLVIGPIFRIAVVTVGTQLCRPWRPRFVWRIREASDYLRFGFKASASSVLFYFYTNVDYAIVGKFFGDHALALYRIAYEVVLEPVRIISEVVREVAFAAFARMRLDRQALIELFIRFTRLNLLGVLIFLGVVVAAAEPITLLVYGPAYVPAAGAMRILALVGILRSLGYVVPPLLDAMGFPGRTLLYQGAAAVIIPVCYVVGAVALGDELGFTSVAVGWAVGYPLVFAVLMAMALYALGLGLGAYLRRVGGLALCIGAATAVAVVVAWLLRGMASGLVLAAVVAAMLATLLPLLQITQGMGVRSMWQAIRGRDGKS